MNPRNRSDIKPGGPGAGRAEQDQRSGKLTEGTVDRILTNSATHPHGIKVRPGERSGRPREGGYPRVNKGTLLLC